MKIIVFLLMTLLLINHLSGQKYLVNDKEWVLKIKQNPTLSPLSFGINKTQAEINRDNNNVLLLVKKFGTKEEAY